MKNFLSNFLLCCICLVVASCNSEVTIGGTADNTKEISLYSFDKGVKSLVQSAVVDKESGTFTMSTAIPGEGLYLLGLNENALYPVYLQAGDCINLSFKENSVTLDPSGASDENIALFDWESGVNDVKVCSFFHYFLPGANSLGAEKFFPMLEKAAAHKKSVLGKLEGKKGEFFTLLRNKINADLDFYALNYIKNSGIAPNDESLPQYYKGVGASEVFNRGDLLDIPFAGKMLDTYVWYLGGGEFTSKWDIKYPVELLSTKELQQEYLLGQASQMKFYDEYLHMVDQVGEDFFDAAYSQRLDNVLQKISWSKPGLAAPDFKGMAPDSTYKSLSDYKGKLVVVDVWATWCEPCRRMMPLFHQLQKEFVGENVEFLSVCVGVWIESEKWLQLSEEFHITKNNFFIAGWQSDFVKDYRISGVPRYLIIDQQGNTVSLNAPNPASPKLREMIWKCLNK
jgi:thiol-disulfide isomerase/thioredoxin